METAIFAANDVDDTALSDRAAATHAFGMFLITEADAVAIRAICTRRGNCRLLLSCVDGFRGSLTTRRPAAYARSIAGWMPLQPELRPVTRLRPRKDA